MRALQQGSWLLKQEQHGWTSTVAAQFMVGSPPNCPVGTLANSSLACAPPTIMLLSCNGHIAFLLQLACELSMAHLQHKLLQHTDLLVNCAQDVMRNGSIL